mmetsp:Transcript_17530/g.54883  ORF Transcript_17530/g.54883 Transcript_17530/m.54883 type:complete len:200 (+) Transcript_17530:219-818(+)
MPPRGRPIHTPRLGIPCAVNAAKLSSSWLKSAYARSQRPWQRQPTQSPCRMCSRKGVTSNRWRLWKMEAFSLGGPCFQRAVHWTSTTWNTRAPPTFAPSLLLGRCEGRNTTSSRPWYVDMNSGVIRSTVTSVPCHVATDAREGKHMAASRSTRAPLSLSAWRGTPMEISSKSSGDTPTQTVVSKRKAKAARNRCRVLSA